MKRLGFRLKKLNKSTARNRGDIDIVGVLHIDVHTVTKEVVADVVHQEHIISLFCVVDHDIRVLWTADQHNTIDSLHAR